MFAILIGNYNARNCGLMREYLVAFSICLADLVEFLNRRIRRHGVDACERGSAQNRSSTKRALCRISHLLKLIERIVGNQIDVSLGVLCKMCIRDRPQVVKR